MRQIKAIFLVFNLCISLFAEANNQKKPVKVLNNLKIVLRNQALAKSLKQRSLPLTKGTVITKSRIQHLINIIKNLKNCDVQYKLVDVGNDKCDLIVTAVSIQDFKEFQVNIIANDSALYNNISELAGFAAEFLSSNTLSKSEFKEFQDDFKRHIQISAMNLGYCNFKITELSIKPSLEREANVISIITEEGDICRISSVDLTNDSPLDTNTLLNMIKIRPGQKFNEAKLDKAVDALNQELFQRNLNYYSPEYSFNVNDDNQVSVHFAVKFSDQPRIKSINFFGNNTIRNSEILKLLPFREGDIISASALSYANQRIKRMFSVRNLESKIQPNPNGTVNVNFYFTQDKDSVLSSLLEVLQLQIGSKSSLQIKVSNLFGYPIKLQGMTYWDFWNYNDWFTNNPMTKSRFPGYGDIFFNTIEDPDFFNAINFDLERIHINFDITRKLDENMFQKLSFGTRSKVIISDFERNKIKDQSFCESVADQSKKFIQNFGKLFCCGVDEPRNPEEDRLKNYLIMASGTGVLRFGFENGAIEFGNTTSRLRMFTKQSSPTSQSVFDNLGLELKNSGDANGVYEYRSWCNTTFTNLKLKRKWEYSFGDIHANANCRVGVQNPRLISDKKVPWRKFLRISGETKYVRDEPMNIDGAKITTKFRFGKIFGDCAFVNHFNSADVELHTDDNVGPFDRKMGMNLGGRWYAGGSIRARYELVNLDDKFVISWYGRTGIFNLSDSGGLTDHASDTAAARLYCGMGIKYKFQLGNSPIKARCGLQLLVDINNLNESIDPIDFGISIG